MLTWILIGVIVLLATALGFSIRYLIKFSRIIMVFEDDISDTINALNDVEDTISNVLKMQIFYDSPDVRKEVDKILEEVKVCRLSVNGLIERFTARSKQQYYFLEQEQESITHDERVIPRLPGQPPDTPNPLQMLQNEGIILDVRHQRKE